MSNNAIMKRNEPQTRRCPTGLAPRMDDDSTGKWTKDGNKQHTSEEVLSSGLLLIKMIR